MASKFAIDTPPAPEPRAATQPPESPIAAAPVPRRPCPEPHSLPESPRPHSPCIRPVRKLRGETRDGAAIPPAPAGRARRCVETGSAVPHFAAEASASAGSSPLPPENAWQPPLLHSNPVCTSRTFLSPSSLPPPHIP